MLKPHLLAGAIDVTEVKEAFADDRVDALASLVERDRTDARDLAVGDEQVSSVGGQAAGLCERRARQGAVDDILGAEPAQTLTIPVSRL